MLSLNSNYGVKSLPVGGFYEERRATYEFNIGNLSLAPNTIIKSANFNAIIASSRRSPGEPIPVSLWGYRGNGTPEASDFEAGKFLRYESLPIGGDYRQPRVSISWDIAPFINQLLSNNEFAFAGLSIRGDRFSVEGVFSDSSDPSDPYANWYPTLEIEPVPEPTTIFGSALALGVGGWLKRKKSSQQNKTTPQA